MKFSSDFYSYDLQAFECIGAKSFDQLLMDPKLCNKMKEKGYCYLNPVQAISLPIGIRGDDLLVQAKAGSGKRLIFSTLIAHAAIGKPTNQCLAVVLTPVSEVAHRIKDTIDAIVTTEASIGVFTDDEDFETCKKSVAGALTVAVGTPHRIAELVKQGVMRLKDCKLFVLDGADELIARPYRDDINWILNSFDVTSAQIIASAVTYPKNLESFLSQLMKSPSCAVRLLSDISPVTTEPMAATEDIINDISTQEVTLDNPPALDSVKEEDKESSTEKSALNDPTAGFNDFNAPTAGFNDFNAPTAGSIDLNAPAAGSIDVNAPAAGSIDLNAPAAGSIDLNAPAVGSNHLNAPAAGSNELNAPPTAGSNDQITHEQKQLEGKKRRKHPMILEDKSPFCFVIRGCNGRDPWEIPHPPLIRQPGRGRDPPPIVNLEIARKYDPDFNPIQTIDPAWFEPYAPLPRFREVQPSLRFLRRIERKRLGIRKVHNGSSNRANYGKNIISRGRGLTGGYGGRSGGGGFGHSDRGDSSYFRGGFANHSNSGNSNTGRGGFTGSRGSYAQTFDTANNQNQSYGYSGRGERGLNNGSSYRGSHGNFSQTSDAAINQTQSYEYSGRGGRGRGFDGNSRGGFNNNGDSSGYTHTSSTGNSYKRGGGFDAYTFGGPRGGQDAPFGGGNRGAPQHNNSPTERIVSQNIQQQAINEAVNESVKETVEAPRKYRFVKPKN